MHVERVFTLGIEMLEACWGQVDELFISYRLTGRYEEATATLQQALLRTPYYLPAHWTLAACYAEVGRLEEARTEVAEAQRLNPNASLEWFNQNVPYKNPAVLERYLDDLRKAGLK